MSDEMTTRGPGDFARYALSEGWDPIPLHGVDADGRCTCSKGAACRTPGKHPENEAWQKRPRLEVQDTYAIWDAASRPVNVGLKAGDPSGFWVLDIDPEHGGEEYLAELEAQHGKLPPTRVHLTGSGGRHYLFALPDFPVSNSRGRIEGRRGIDVRGNGGMVVAPGSRSGKGPYSTLTPFPIAAAPAWLLEMIRPKTSRDLDFDADKVPSTPYAELDAESRARSDQYRDAIITGEAARLDAMREAATANLSAYRGEPWNETTFMVACNLLEVAQSDWMNFSPEEARAILEAHAPRDSGFTINDIRGCLRSAAARVRGSARAMPDSITGANPTWDLLTEGVRTKGPKGAADPGDLLNFGPQADPDAKGLWRINKNGTASLNVGVLASMIQSMGPLRTDEGGGFWAYEKGVYSFNKNVVRDRCVLILDDAYSREAVGKASDHIAATASKINLNDVAHPDMINFQNRMVAWRTGDVVPHDPDLGSTFQVATTWEPDADCPLFSRWVDAMLSPSAAKVLWEVIGYSMLPHNPQQIFVFLEGPGGNGKGVVQRLITALLGARSVSSLSILEIDGGNQFALSSLIGKAANISGETPVKYVEDSSNLKKITGGDWLKIEHKGKDAFMARIHALPIFAGNEVPRMADDSKGFMQRAVVIPFHQSATEHKVDGFSEAALLAELPGIARRGVEALRNIDLSDLSLRSAAFSIDAEDMIQAKSQFEEATNPELEWIRNYTRPVKDHWSSSMELYRGYGGRLERPSRKFMKTLREVYGEPKRRVPASAQLMGSTKRDFCYEVEFSSTMPFSGLHAVPDDPLDAVAYGV